MSQQRLRIPHPTDQAVADIVGILQRAVPSKPTHGEPLALIIHGQLAHKDQSFHRRLADSLARDRGLDSFRYDLRGQGGETEGPWIMGDYRVDADDLACVVEYLQREYGYRIHLIIAHSRGSAIASYYLAARPHPPIPFFVNISGRYDMTRVLHNKRYNDGIEKEGHFDWHLKIAGKPHVQRITMEGMRQFAEWDNSYLVSSFPPDVRVLTVHGDADEAVPVQDAYSFHAIYSNRSPGTSTLSIVPGESHNFTRPFDEPCESIMAWLSEVDPIPSASKAKM